MNVTYYIAIIIIIFAEDQGLEEQMADLKIQDKVHYIVARTRLRII